jgi:hypothetical protein
MALLSAHTHVMHLCFKREGENIFEYVGASGFLVSFVQSMPCSCKISWPVVLMPTDDLLQQLPRCTFFSLKRSLLHGQVFSFLFCEILLFNFISTWLIMDTEVRDALHNSHG